MWSSTMTYRKQRDITAEPVRALHSVLIFRDHSEMLAVALELFNNDGGGA
jgi:hypothetical protein